MTHNASALILAAGSGTRMKSNLPKVAHKLLDKPLVRHVVDACKKSVVSQIVCVLGYGRDTVEPLVSDCGIAYQEHRLGTGDAVACARRAIEGKAASLVVISGDTPLIRPETINSLVRIQQEEQASMVLLTMHQENPFGYGRIKRGTNDEVVRIVEQKDCTEEEALVQECNAGIYCFDVAHLFWALDRVDNNNAQAEYYLTDVLEILKNASHKVLALQVEDETECLGINSRSQLAHATKVLQRRINVAHMDAGITMLDPDQVWIGSDVVLDTDVEILPQTYLWGNTRVGSGSVIGPHTRLNNVSVGCNCCVDETIASDCVLEDEVSTGPRAYLRPGTYMECKSKAGTHVEIKKSRIGEGSKVPHLSYIGDAQIGKNVNIGAGSITCNYDGKQKHTTRIDDNVFVGSDTMLVAPLHVGEGSLIGAGSVITKDVPPYSLGLGRAQQVIKEDYCKREKL